MVGERTNGDQVLVLPPGAVTLATSAKPRGSIGFGRGGRRIEIPVACDARDLGAHVCTGKRQVGTTGAMRMNQAIARAAHILNVHVGHDTNERLMATSAIANTLCAYEAAPLAGKQTHAGAGGGERQAAHAGHCHPW